MSDLRKRTQEIAAEYDECRKEQSEKVATAQLFLAFARAEAAAVEATDSGQAAVIGWEAERAAREELQEAAGDVLSEFDRDCGMSCGRKSWDRLQALAHAAEPRPGGNPVVTETPRKAARAHG